MKITPAVNAAKKDLKQSAADDVALLNGIISAKGTNPEMKTLARVLRRVVLYLRK